MEKINFGLEKEQNKKYTFYLDNKKLFSFVIVGKKAPDFKKKYFECGPLEMSELKLHLNFGIKSLTIGGFSDISGMEIENTLFLEGPWSMEIIPDVRVSEIEIFTPTTISMQSRTHRLAQVTETITFKEEA